MQKISILLLFSAYSSILCSQFEIEDLSTKADKIIPYDTSYFTPDYQFSNAEVMKGLRGHNLIFLDFPIVFQAMVNGKLSSVNKKEYLFKPFTVKEFKKIKYWDMLVCVNGNDTIYFKPSSSCKIIILEGYNRFTKSLLGKYYSTQNQTITDFSETKIKVAKNTEAELFEIKIAKISSFDFGLKYSFKTLSDTIVMVQELFNYKKVGTDFLGNLNFTYDLVYNWNLRNEENYNSIKTSKFKSFIAKSQVTVGMSEKEILLSWGAPDRFMTRQGFDKVAVYTINDVLIYYKNNKAVKIL
ncbi:hypothetical protein N9M15_00345 [Bacteroidia bacterium]|nr:hypothetical protein [Bacteroidia bacterium]